MRDVLVALLTLWLTLIAGHAGAQSPADKQAARRLGEEGDALFDAGDYKAALERYQRAAQIVDVPTLRLREARTLDKLGRLVEAHERYLAVTRTEVAADAPADHRDAVTLAREEHEALAPRIPSVVVSYAGDSKGLGVTLDGTAYPLALLGERRPIDPGHHRLEARRGGATFEREFDVQEGGEASITVELAEGQPSKPRTQPSPVTAPKAPVEDESTSIAWPLGWAALGLGVAGLAVGAITGGIALDKKSELEQACGDALECLPDQHPDAEDYNRLRIVSAVGFYAGAPLAIAGIVLVIVGAPGDGDERAWTPVLGPGWAGVSGSF
jgi:hypothetical protein